ncbi:unnamed protein product [Caenorhabditis brenneri]
MFLYKYLVLSLALSLTGSVLADPVNFHLKVTCDPQGDTQDLGTWCGKLTIFEADSMTDHDVLRVSNFCTNGEETKFDYQLFPGGDYSTSYEINYTLTHNCTIDGLVRCIKPKDSQEVSVAGETHVNFHLGAYQIGEARECLDPNHGSIWNTIFG